MSHLSRMQALPFFILTVRDWDARIIKAHRDKSSKTRAYSHKLYVLSVSGDLWQFGYLSGIFGLLGNLRIIFGVHAN